MRRLRIGVLMGGLSVEREVSFNSGRTICDHLDSIRYDAVPLFHTQNNELYLLPWRFLYRGKTTDFEHRLASEAQFISWSALSCTVDYLYIAEHGRFAEDGTLQGFLEVLGVPYFGSGVFASALCMDKVQQKYFLKAAGIEVARGVVVRATEISSEPCEGIISSMHNAGIAFPCVVKPVHEGSSMGVSVVREAGELSTALHTACHVTPGLKQDVLIEEKLEGMEFNCTVLIDYKSNKPMPLMPTEIILDGGEEFFDYDQKYMPGRAFKHTPPRCDESVIKKIHDTCVDVMRVLGMEWMARIYGFATADERVVIIDPNTLTGTAPSSFFFREAAEHGMGHADVINHLIETKLHQDGVMFVEESKRKMFGVGDKKMRVAVLFGGDSDEREISLESGRNIVYKLSPTTYQVLPIFVSAEMKLYCVSHSLLVRNSTSEIAALVTPEMEIAWEELPKITDFVFIALHGGKGENGAVQGTLEMLQLPYNGSGVLSSALCADKHRTIEFLRARGFDVPKGCIISAAQWINKRQIIVDELVSTFGLPLIIKPNDGGCSVSVLKASSDDQLGMHFDALFASGKECVLVEECLSGMELTVGIIGNDEPQVLSPSWSVARCGVLSIEEKFLPGCGENQTPAPLSDAGLALVKDAIKRAYLALGCRGYARIDCFYQMTENGNEGRCVIFEVNTLPGMTPATCIFHQAAEVGIKPMKFLDQIVELGFERHQDFRIQQPMRERQKQ